jgi:hypothetical protein
MLGEQAFEGYDEFDVADTGLITAQRVVRVGRSRREASDVRSEDVRGR